MQGSRSVGFALALGLALAWASPASAAVLPQGTGAACDLFLDYDTTADRAGLLNPRDILGISRHGAETAAACSASLGALHGELRPSWQRENGETSTTMLVRQLYADLPVASPATLTVGRRMRGWDVSYVAQPIDFWGERKDFHDLEDRLRQLRASSLVAFDHIDQSWTLGAAAGEDLRRTDGKAGNQAVLTAETEVGSSHLQFVTQRTPDQPWGFGGGISRVIGSALELHASYFGRYGTERPIHRALLDGDLRYYTAAEQPVDSYRLHDGHWYGQSVVGGQWTAENGVNLLLEWLHDDSGLSRSQWNRLMDLGAFHAAGAGRGVPQSAVDGNLKFDALALAQGPAMRDYLFGRIASDFAGGTVEVYALVNAADRSTSSGLRLTVKPTPRAEAWLDYRANGGGGRSEFGTVPSARTALLALRYFLL